MVEATGRCEGCGAGDELEECEGCPQQLCRNCVERHRRVGCRAAIRRQIIERAAERQDGGMT